MPKDNILQFPDRFEGREPNRKQILKNRLGELEVENEYLNSDLDFLSDQLDKNMAEASELLRELQLIVEEELDDSLVEFKSEFGVDISFLADFDPTKPKE
jgi:predicted nuclease with TOPRIM domain